MELARYGSSQIAVGPNTLPCLRGGTNFVLSDNRSTQCPGKIPSSRHLCVSPGLQECEYQEDVCCCGQCSSTFTAACRPDAVTGKGLWEGAWDVNTICPSGGCGDQGKFLFGKQTLPLNYIDIAGVVTSPNFPNYYPNRIDRTDMIYVAAEKIIEIEFTNFTVQPHPQCRANRLSIIDQDGSELLGKSCGFQLPPGEV